MLTRSGWSAMVLAGCLFVIGRLFGIIELYIIGAGLIAAVVWAVAQTRVPLPEMKVQRLVAPAVVQVGSPARVSLTVSNVGRRRSPTVLLWEPAGGAGNASSRRARGCSPDPEDSTSCNTAVAPRRALHGGRSC